ncbi:MAG: heavy-metal-associated domain-containing protein [Bacteroidales bacterium]|nr:heavy-metal-associated domain-containing protein [Bacteroidales bacterium]
MKKTFVILLALSLALFSCKSGGNDSKTSGEQSADINPANVVLIDMDVNGMTCTGCENTIKTGL